jgi:hypothetical protein
MQSLGKNAPLYILALVTIIIIIVMLTKKKSDFGAKQQTYNKSDFGAKPPTYNKSDFGTRQVLPNSVTAGLIKNAAKARGAPPVSTLISAVSLTQSPILNFRNLLSRANSRFTIFQNRLTNSINMVNKAPNSISAIEVLYNKIDDVLKQRQGVYPTALCCYGGPAGEWDYQTRLLSNLNFGGTILTQIKDGVKITNDDKVEAQSAIDTFRPYLTTAQNFTGMAALNAANNQTQFNNLVNALNTFEWRASYLLQFDELAFTYTNGTWNINMELKYATDKPWF